MLQSERDCTLADVAAVVGELRSEHGVLSITDIVLNHTANESVWLTEHPEAAYNCSNAPWLRPAFLLDRLFWHLSLDIEDGRWKEQGLPAGVVNTEQHLEAVRRLFTAEYLPMLKLEEFYLCNESAVIEQFEHHLIRFIYGADAKKGASLDDAPIVQHPAKVAPSKNGTMELFQDAQYRRFGSSIDFDSALHAIIADVKFVGELDDREALGRWINFALLHLEKALKEQNDRVRGSIKDHLASAVENVIKGARYERLDAAGPKVAKVTRKTPLATQYFTDEINGHHNKGIIYFTF